ncbi:MAG: glycosyltransferase [Ruminococcaceae bacterium]|nr:glycosyltransferase [Oscillospiraceae bacterium]
MAMLDKDSLYGTDEQGLETERILRQRLEYTQAECGRLQRALVEEEEKNEQLSNELASCKAECKQLRETENSLREEVRELRSSRTWKIGRIFTGTVRFLVPVGSKRALALRLLWSMVRHPIKFFKSLSFRKFKKFFRLLRKGNIEGIKLLIQSNITGEPAPSTIDVIVPQIVPVELDKKKSQKDYPVVQVPQWDDPKVSIVIPVYNQFEYTYHCVCSIIRNSGDISYEIIIANDCSTDLTTKIEEILPGVTCVTNAENLRFLRNCNHAAQYAKGQYILFLNNDTQVQPDWLEPLVTLIESADDIGMVGSKLIYPDGLLQEAGGILWKDGSAWNFGNRQNPALPQFNYVKQVDYISGAAIMLSRVLWEQIGGFDDAFAPAYCEDSDLAFTVRKLGYRVMYQPKSVVVHFEGVSNGTDTSSGQKQYQVINAKKFREKWAQELQKHPENGENVFQARDYSYDKKTLLMIDHYVPHFDRDAGSRTVYQYLRLFVEAGFNVKFIGDNFYQHEPYTTALQQLGIEVLYGAQYAESWKSWIRENSEHIDYVFLNRPHIAPKYLDFLRQNTKAKIVYYGHDLAFLREMREYEITGDLSLKDSAADWKNKELSLMAKADMAYYPSYVEVDEIHKIDPGISVKAIPAYIFDNVSWGGYDFDTRKDIMFIGGFSHRPNVDAVKWIAEEILPELLRYLPDVKIHILGSNAPKEILALANDHLIMEGFVTDEQLEWFYRNCRISLVPLRYGAGIKGKVVEAMRYGTPVVTTTIGAEGIPDAEKAILIEDDAKTMAKKMAELYCNASRLEEMSRNCIGYIQDNYSTKNAISVIGPEFGLQ